MRLLNLTTATLVVAATSAAAASETQYPLTLENCGVEITIETAPQRAVGIGQNSTEIMLLLGLADRMVGTAVWVSPVLERVAADNEKVPRLADSQPSFEAVVGTEPDFVAAQFMSAIGPEGRVGTREQFSDLDVPSYISPTDCATTGNERADGSRATLWSPELLYREVEELAAIFDVADRGTALVAEFKDRVEAVRTEVSADGERPTILFWFSSPEVAGDAWVAGRNGASSYVAETVGATNVVETDAEWPLMSWEAIATEDPDVIVIGTMSRRNQPSDDPAVKRQFLSEDPVARELTAVTSGRIVEMDAQAMNPTLRTIDGLEVVADALRRFGPID